MYSSDYIWGKILGHMEDRLSAPVVSTWFDDAKVIELTEDRLILYSPSEFRRDTIQRRCDGYIRDAMKDLFDKDITVEVFGEEELNAFRNKNRKPDFIEFNPQFTFDNFVVGSSNQFAHGAAIAVANNPADSYNPLFIYGPSGLGKMCIRDRLQHPQFGCRIACGSVGPTVQRARQCEALFSQRGQAKQAFAHALQTDISPIDDIRASAQYRRDVLCNLIYQRYLEKEA